MPRNKHVEEDAPGEVLPDEEVQCRGEHCQTLRNARGVGQNGEGDSASPGFTPETLGASRNLWGPLSAGRSLARMGHFLRIIGHLVEEVGYIAETMGGEYRDAERFQEDARDDTQSFMQTGKTKKPRGGGRRRVPVIVVGEDPETEARPHGTDRAEEVPRSDTAGFGEDGHKSQHTWDQSMEDVGGGDTMHRNQDNGPLWEEHLTDKTGPS